MTFDGASVESAAEVGTVAQARALIDRQAQIALVLQCSELVGILDAVLGMTIRWALDRHSFGRPLASYQALKHRLADMKMWLEASRAITDGAVADVGARSADAALTVSAAKSYLGEHAGVIAQDCVQLHGGIGVTWEHDLHMFLRRITLYRSMFGTPAEHHSGHLRATAQCGVGGMTESVQAFAARARTWLAENMPRLIQPVRRSAPAAMTPPGSAFVNCKSSFTQGDSPESAFHGSTAGSAWTSPIRKRSTPRPSATRCR